MSVVGSLAGAVMIGIAAWRIHLDIKKKKNKEGKKYKQAVAGEDTTEVGHLPEPFSDVASPGPLRDDTVTGVHNVRGDSPRVDREKYILPPQSPFSRVKSERKGKRHPRRTKRNKHRNAPLPFQGIISISPRESPMQGDATTTPSERTWTRVKERRVGTLAGVLTSPESLSRDILTKDIAGSDCRLSNEERCVEDDEEEDGDEDDDDDNEEEEEEEDEDDDNEEDNDDDDDGVDYNNSDGESWGSSRSDDMRICAMEDGYITATNSRGDDTKVGVDNLFIALPYRNPFDSNPTPSLCLPSNRLDSTLTCLILT